MWNELKLAPFPSLYHMFDSILSAQQLAKPAHSEKVLGLSPEGWTERLDCLVPTTCSVVDLTLKPEGSVDTFMRRGCQGLSTDMDDSPLSLGASLLVSHGWMHIRLSPIQLLSLNLSSPSSLPSSPIKRLVTPPAVRRRLPLLFLLCL